MQACAASARASPALRTETTQTLLSSTNTLENVAAVGVVMNCRVDSKHAMPCGSERATQYSHANVGVSEAGVSG